LGLGLTREEEQGDVVGFWHTHPAGSGTTPSRRDIRTMQAWCSALGKPLLCLISEEGRENEAAVYLFDNDESEGQPLPHNPAGF
jgi:proteasome lid subunit RPN8/RPN11